MNEYDSNREWYHAKYNNIEVMANEMLSEYEKNNKRHPACGITDLMRGEISTKNARDDLSDMLAKVLRKPEDEFNKGVARGLRIALMFIDYHDSEHAIRKLRKGEI